MNVQLNFIDYEFLCLGSGCESWFY